ncbi:unnamed protein product [Cuscuta epithymum]|uniref:Uncharacterized protein n=1 Tax=Cuscuta epithymum TaxID=186058 RepID=A0AAV0D3V2_9ASTE|nr:unnamed protein product [Cuscuta epithymum]
MVFILMNAYVLLEFSSKNDMDEAHFYICATINSEMLHHDIARRLYYMEKERLLVEKIGHFVELFMDVNSDILLFCKSGIVCEPDMKCPVIANSHWNRQMC